MKKFIFLSFVLTSILSACDKTTVVLCGDPFEITKDLLQTICDIKVQLDSVQDSRCPTGVQCVRAGEAIAKLTFTKGNETVTKSLQVIGSSPKPDTVLVFNKKAILLNITPYPVAPTPIQQKDYKAQMKFE